MSYVDLLARLLIVAPFKARAELEEVRSAVSIAETATARIAALNQAAADERLDDVASAAAAILAAESAVNDFARALDRLFVAIGASADDRARVHARLTRPMTEAMDQQRKVLEQWLAASKAGCDA